LLGGLIDVDGLQHVPRILPHHADSGCSGLTMQVRTAVSRSARP
jgi:hypothetical protein